MTGCTSCYYCYCYRYALSSNTIALDNARGEYLFRVTLALTIMRNIMSIEYYAFTKPELHELSDHRHLECKRNSCSFLCCHSSYPCGAFRRRMQFRKKYLDINGSLRRKMSCNCMIFSKVAAIAAVWESQLQATQER